MAVEQKASLLLETANGKTLNHCKHNQLLNISVEHTNNLFARKMKFQIDQN